MRSRVVAAGARAAPIVVWRLEARGRLRSKDGRGVEVGDAEARDDDRADGACTRQVPVLLRVAVAPAAHLALVKVHLRQAQASRKQASR